jgi:branched-subunit amino acid permease
MTHQLKSRDIIALGFMTFALFVGAGNIIFPQWLVCRRVNTSGLRLLAF